MRSNIHRKVTWSTWRFIKKTDPFNSPFRIMVRVSTSVIFPKFLIVISKFLAHMSEMAVVWVWLFPKSLLKRRKVRYGYKAKLERVVHLDSVSKLQMRGANCQWKISPVKSPVPGINDGFLVTITKPEYKHSKWQS